MFNARLHRGPSPPRMALACRRAGPPPSRSSRSLSARVRIEAAEVSGVATLRPVARSIRGPVRKLHGQGADCAPSSAEAPPAHRASSSPGFAQAFAAVVALNQAGCSLGRSGSGIFPPRSRVKPQRDGEGSEAAYYRQWLAAFERLLADRSLVLAEEITATGDWRRSYLHTPHGKPVCLRRDLPDIPPTVGHRHHDHHHERRDSATPVAVHLGSPPKPGIARADAARLDVAALRPTRKKSPSKKPLDVEPRHSSARDQRPLRVRPKSARGLFPVDRDSA